METEENVNYFIFAGPAKQNDKMATLQKRYEYVIEKSKIRLSNLMEILEFGNCTICSATGWLVMVSCLIKLIF